MISKRQLPDADRAGRRAICAAARPSRGPTRRVQSSRPEKITAGHPAGVRCSTLRYERKKAGLLEISCRSTGDSGKKLSLPPGGSFGQYVAQLFKWIKQHLRIKAFFGTSENAVKTQIWIAISVYVLVDEPDRAAAACHAARE